MLIAGTVNLCILLLAAANLAGVEGTDTLEGAYAALSAGIGPVVATLFAVGLLASGLASTSRSARTRAPRSCTACCTSAFRSSPAGSSR